MQRFGNLGLEDFPRIVVDHVRCFCEYIDPAASQSSPRFLPRHIVEMYALLESSSTPQDVQYVAIVYFDNVDFKKIVELTNGVV